MKGRSFLVDDIQLSRKTLFPYSAMASLKGVILTEAKLFWGGDPIVRAANFHFD